MDCDIFLQKGHVFIYIMEYIIYSGYQTSVICLTIICVIHNFKSVLDFQKQIGYSRSIIHKSMLSYKSDFNK